MARINNDQRVVVALGGNAQGDTPEEQIERVRAVAPVLLKMIEQGNEIIITHGNGPQVGMIQKAYATANEASEGSIPAMDLPECGAMSQGYIGYHLQNAIREELLQRGLNHPVATIVTQVVVDIEDPAFQNPTKPIGSFYSEEKAKEIAKETGFVMKEDSGRGYRRVVASPKPIAVVEDRTVNALIEAGQVVITVGGGGIPVIRKGIHLEGVAAVIDKDFASEVLAEMVDADYLIILTAVEKVALNFGKKDEKWLDHVTVAEMEQYMTEGHFAPGSMLPKVEASVAFAKSKEGRTALITSLENARDGIAGKTGTHISI